jgi:cadmium resistance protein CadD (predicted permease)
VIVPSDNDRGGLAEIEQGLYHDDPRLAHRFDTWSVPHDRRWLAILLIAVGIAGSVVGTLIPSGATTVLLGFFPVTAGIAMWYLGES